MTTTSTQLPLPHARRALVALGCALVALGCAVPAAPAAQAAPARSVPPSVRTWSDCGYRVTTEGVRLRSGPGIRHPALGQLHRDDTLFVTRAQGDWYRVRLAYDSGSHYGTRKSSGLREGATGWVVRRALRAHVCTRLD